MTEGMEMMIVVVWKKLYGKNGGDKTKYPNEQVYVPEAQEQALPQPA
jgi:hypothetical protein